MPKRKSHKRRRSSKKLSAGIHWVKIKGQKCKRKVKVSKKGKWKFMKGSKCPT